MPLVLHESAEMYLETILNLEEELDRVRAVDIAQRMGYSKPTISEWMGKLRDAGYVTLNEAGGITLTKAGRDVAVKIYERHVVLSSFFRAIGVTEETAVDDACRVEHYISDETFNCLKSYMDKNHPQA